MPSDPIQNSQRLALAANREDRAYRRLLEGRGPRPYSPAEVTASIDYYADQFIRISTRLIHITHRLNVLAERVESVRTALENHRREEEQRRSRESSHHMQHDLFFVSLFGAILDIQRRLDALDGQHSERSWIRLAVRGLPHGLLISASNSEPSIENRSGRMGD